MDLDSICFTKTFEDCEINPCFLWFIAALIGLNSHRPVFFDKIGYQLGKYTRQLVKRKSSLREMIAERLYYILWVNCIDVE
jgi:hypothetical protein